MHSSLRLAGLLNPLDAPHHMRADDVCPFREGVVLDRTVKKGAGSFVDIGKRKVLYCCTAVLLYYHAVLSCCTIMLYCRTVLSCCTIVLHYRAVARGVQGMGGVLKVRIVVAWHYT